MKTSLPSSLRFALLLSVALGALHSWAQQSQLDRLNSRVTSLIEQHKFVEAEPLANQALQLVEKTYGLSDRRAATPLNNLALVYIEQKLYSAAELLLKQALQLDESAAGSGNSDLTRDLRNLAALYAKQGETAKARAYLQLALSLDEEGLSADGALAAADRRALAELPRNQADPLSPYASSSPAPASAAAQAETPEPASEPQQEPSAPAAAQASAPAAQPASESGGAASEPGPGSVFDTPPAASGGGCSDPNVSCDAAASHVDTPDETRARMQQEAAREKAEAAERRELESRMKDYEKAEKDQEQKAEASDSSAPIKGAVASAGFGEGVPVPAQPAPPPPPPLPPSPTSSASAASEPTPTVAVATTSAAPPASSAPASSAPASASPPSSPVSIADLGRSPLPNSKKTTYDFDDQVIEGDLARPGAAAEQVTPPPIERYPNIEAPDTVALGQEIAVQVSLTTEQLAPETKILSGAQHEGKLQLQMAAGENQWTLTVNLTAPGMEFTRGGNTADINIKRDGDSTLAVFYLRPEATAVSAQEPRRDTRILATLLHDGAFIARLSRPLAIIGSTAQPALRANAASLYGPSSPTAKSASPQISAAAAPASARNSAPAIQFNPDLYAPDLTIVENHVGNTLRLVFFTPYTAPVEADISDPDALHAWIQSNYQQMAMHGRGLTPETSDGQDTRQHAADYLDGFGDELYDRFAPQAFKNLFWKLMEDSRNRSPENPNAKWRFETIQVLSDDPAIPWELMRPVRPDGTGRMDFLGLHFMIARWPLATHGAARPPQALAVRQSEVIAPVYHGARQLASTGDEMKTIEKIEGFRQVAGNYASVRDLAMHPPQGIVHFAGHGAVFNADGVPEFAILLEDSQMDPATWNALVPAAAPTHPLYFFNACDVGESRRFLNDVDGWAPVLLSGGASGYIGALWPVNDATAEAVAASFYHNISAGISGAGADVAEALAKARADVYSRTKDPTALAYVFYGDPDFVVTSAANAAAR
jgi:tetratricopeptide (TPR) repeat protein